MARTVQTVGADVPLAQITAMFHHHSLGYLLVVDPESETLLGVISEREVIAHSWSSATSNVAAKKALDIMLAEPKVVTPNMELREAALIMLRYDVTCLPVVNSSGKPIGMVTQTDLLAAAFPTPTSRPNTPIQPHSTSSPTDPSSLF